MWQVLSQKHLTLDQTGTPLEIDRAEVEQFYQPLARQLIEAGHNRLRLLTAIAGPPGSGKTAFATLLAAVINAELHSEQAVVVQQDGWHYTNAYLDSHTIHHNGQEIPLRRRKGSPETYDTRAAYLFLQRARQGETLRYPVYSRALHDPVADSGVLEAHHRWILVEGNYWLFQDDAWRPFQALFDVTIFLTAIPETLIDGLTQRHLRGGKSPEVVHQHMQTVDIPNITRVLQESSPAQIIVEKKDCQRIARITGEIG